MTRVTSSRRFQAGDYKYEHVEGWGQFPGTGMVSDVATDSQDRVYACVRTGVEQGAGGRAQLQPRSLKKGEIWVFDRDGTHLASWGQDLLDVPHGLWIGPEDDIYHTDAGNHTVTKFNPEGRLLMTLGSNGRAGAPGHPFNSPTRAVLSSSGEIFVSDGYGQNRCHRFTSDGELALSWGSDEPGREPGEFNLPHDITVDQNNRVYVLDRSNDRIQVFSIEGEFIEQWTDVPGGNDSVIDQNDVIHIATGRGNIIVRTLDGNAIGVWGEHGDQPGQFSGGPHGIWLDSRGDVYVAEVGTTLGLQKFARV